MRSVWKVNTTFCIYISSIFRRVRKIVRSDCQFLRVYLSVCLHVRRPVRIEKLGSRWTDFCEIWYFSIFRKSVEKIQFSLNLTRIAFILREDQYTIYIIFHSFLFKMRNVSGKRCGDKTHILFSIYIFFSKIVPFWETWENIVELGRPRVTTWGMRIVCWIPKTTNKHSEYIIRITFTRQQWLHERTLMLRYMYIAYLVFHFYLWTESTIVT